VKWKPYGKLSVAKYGAPFFLRKGTSDYYTFDQVFLRDQYGIDFPFMPQTIVDAGANIGLASVYFAHRYPKAKIVAIEPSRENFQMVLKNIAAYPQVKANCMGLWNKDVYLAITNTEGVKNAFMVAETDADHPDAIPAVSLETIMRGEGWDQIDLLKIDIEGAEKEVFSSGTDYWLPRTKAIVIELHDNMKKGCSQAVFKAISQYPFSCSLQDENLIFIRE
ncbi:MAG: FkbM family methyltransferase, partial [Sphingobacteriia bacterium]